jgi:RNA polymerase sigma factor (sigma-70 family)
MSIEQYLWQQISKGDKESYAEVYRGLFPRFYNHGHKFTSDSLLVEDAAQEALVLLWERREKLPGIKNVETYYYAVYHNNLFAAIRKQQLLAGEQELPETPEFSIESVIISGESEVLRSAELQAALKTLTSRQLEAIFLRFYEGFSYEEVSEMLGITVKSTYKIVARALALLKENMLVQLMLCF